MRGLPERGGCSVPQSSPEFFTADEVARRRARLDGAWLAALVRHSGSSRYAVVEWLLGGRTSTRRNIFQDACSIRDSRPTALTLLAVSEPKVDGRKRTVLDIFRTIAWYETVTHESSYDTPARLEHAFQHNGEGRKRLWERYGKFGKPTPSVTIKGRPGIVAIVGKRHPRTRRVFEHPLWIALDPHFVPHVPVINELLLQMHEDVVWNFFEDGVPDGEMPRRAWWVVEDESLWEYPYDEAPLKLDLLATFLLIFREAKAAGRSELAHAFAKRVRAQLHDAQACIELRRFQAPLLQYVLENFLGPAYEKVDSSVPRSVADDYSYAPAPRTTYRDRGPLL